MKSGNYTLGVTAAPRGKLQDEFSIASSYAPVSVRRIAAVEIDRLSPNYLGRLG